MRITIVFLFFIFCGSNIFSQIVNPNQNSSCLFKVKKLYESGKLIEAREIAKSCVDAINKSEIIFLEKSDPIAVVVLEFKKFVINSLTYNQEKVELLEIITTINFLLNEKKDAIESYLQLLKEKDNYYPKFGSAHPDLFDFSENFSFKLKSQIGIDIRSDWFDYKTLNNDFSIAGSKKFETVSQSDDSRIGIRYTKYFGKDRKFAITIHPRLTFIEDLEYNAKFDFVLLPNGSISDVMFNFREDQHYASLPILYNKVFYNLKNKPYKKIKPPKMLRLYGGVEPNFIYKSERLYNSILYEDLGLIESFNDTTNLLKNKFRNRWEWYGIIGLQTELLHLKAINLTFSLEFRGNFSDLISQNLTESEIWGDFGYREGNFNRNGLSLYLSITYGSIYFSHTPSQKSKQFNFLKEERGKAFKEHSLNAFYNENYQEAYNYYLLLDELGISYDNVHQAVSIALYAQKPEKAIQLAEGVVNSVKKPKLKQFIRSSYKDRNFLVAKSNLAFAYLLNDHWNKTKDIFIELNKYDFNDKNRYINETIDNLEKAGIESQYFKQIREIFSYKKNINAYELESIAFKAFDKGDYLEAYDYIKKAIEVNPNKHRYWYALSYYALFVNKPEEAIHAARQVLSLKKNKRAKTVETNLALGLLLSNQYQWSDAKEIYLKWKELPFPRGIRTWDEVFLEDISNLEAAGITHPDFERVRVLFE